MVSMIFMVHIYGIYGIYGICGIYGIYGICDIYIYKSLNLISMISLIYIYSMRSGTAPDPGPTLDSAYVPGTPGADWTDEEVHVTRMRILQVAFLGNNVASPRY